MTDVPPIAIESAKEAAHRLLELCITDAPVPTRAQIRTHALDVIEALTPDEDPFHEEEPAPFVVAGVSEIRLVDLSIDPDPNAFGGTLTILSPVVCPECEQGKCGNCDTTAWDHDLDAPAACSCTHPEVTGA